MRLVIYSYLFSIIHQRLWMGGGGGDTAADSLLPPFKEHMLDFLWHSIYDGSVDFENSC